MSATTALIADDLELFLEVARTFLVRRGFELLTAHDGAEACAAMRRDPALAFTPIIIMSATGGPEVKERCLRSGCTNFVVKPGRAARWWAWPAT